MAWLPGHMAPRPIKSSLISATRRRTFGRRAAATPTHAGNAIRPPRSSAIG